MGLEQVLEKVQHAYAQKERQLIAIEGKCGSGKSTLVAKIKEVCPVNVLHMEQFLLPKEQQRDPNGGNIDFQRLQELLTKINEHTEGDTYSVFNTKLQQYEDKSFVDTPIFIVEGVYSMHPKLAALYDWAVFLRVSEEAQILRLNTRESKEKLSYYLTHKMPIENHYFGTLHIEQQCEIILNEQELAI